MMMLWESGSVDANGLALHYRRSGRETGRPALVLSHGISDDGGCWIPIAEHFVDQFDVVLVDARGHGRSAMHPTDYSAQAQATDLIDLIAALDLRRPYLLGHSMGAITTLAAAGMAPHIPSAILVEDPPPRLIGGGDDDGPVPPDMAKMRAWLTEMKRMTRDDLLAAGPVRNPTWNAAEFSHWADAKARMSPNVVTLLDPSQPGRTAAMDWNAVLRQIACPVLLITGDPELGGIATPEFAERLGAIVPHLTVAHVPGAGHNIRREQPTLYLEAVRAFLADLPAAARP